MVVLSRRLLLAGLLSFAACAPGAPAAAAAMSGTSGADKRRIAKRDLLAAVEPLDRGVNASDEDVEKVEILTQQLEKLNPNPKSLSSPLINGRWELMYTTSGAISGKGKSKRLRPTGPMYQDIDAPGRRLKNHLVIQPLPFVEIPNSVLAELTPTSESAVKVQLVQFRIGFVKTKAPESAHSALDTTYVDEEIRIGRGAKGNLFVLRKTDGMEPDFS